VTGVGGTSLIDGNAGSRAWVLLPPHTGVVLLAL